MAQDKNIGQQGNQNWDDQNDKRTSGGTSDPNPQRFENKNLEQDANQERTEETEERSGETHEPHAKRSGSAFNEDKTATGYGSSQRSERENVGPLDADLSDLPSEKRLDNSNQTGPGLG